MKPPTEEDDMNSTGPEISFTAFATTSTNKLGAGISVYRQVMEDGVLRESDEVARETADLSLDDEDGDLDTDAADLMLAGLGFEIAGGWTWSDGQWAAKVERI